MGKRTAISSGAHPIEACPQPHEQAAHKTFETVDANSLERLPHSSEQSPKHIPLLTRASHLTGAADTLEHSHAPGQVEMTVSSPPSTLSREKVPTSGQYPPGTPDCPIAVPFQPGHRTPNAYTLKPRKRNPSVVDGLNAPKTRRRCACA